MGGEDRTESQSPIPSAQAKERSEDVAGAAESDPGSQTEQEPYEPKTAPAAGAPVAEPSNADPTVDQNPDEIRRARMPSKFAYNVPGYELIEPVGDGTFGVVWRAKAVGTGYQVAIKFLTSNYTLGWQLLQFEVRQLAQFHEDPGIVQLVDIEPQAEPPYFVMKYAENGSLANRLKSGPLPLAKAIELFQQIVRAMAYVHEKGILHCDLKPGNILLDARHRALIADFGQSHLSSDASPALGTFFYMAPEQATAIAQLPDTRWDVYALGSIFFHMLTGSPARDDPSARQELRGTGKNLAQRLQYYREWVGKAPAPREHRHIKGIDSYLVRIVDTCLKTEPEERYRNAGAILAALHRRERCLQQRPYFVAGLVAPVLLLVVLSLFGWWQASRTLDRTRASLVTQQRQANFVSARLVARNVKEQLLERLNFLNKEAANLNFRDHMRAGPRAQAELKKDLQAFSDQTESQGIDFVDRWMVMDATEGRLWAAFPDGTTRAGLPFTGHNFSWRDYYNGKGDQLSDKKKFYKPAGKTYVSQPYKSVAKDGGLRIALSVPVRDPENNKKIVGVLATTIVLDRLSRWLEQVELKDGFIVLVDAKRHALRHRNKRAISPKVDTNPKRWQCDVYDQVFAGEDGHTIYADPVDQKTYIAGYARVPQTPDTKWAVLVQHEYDKVTAPVEELKNELLMWGGVMLTVATILLFGLWLLSLRILQREEVLTQG